MISKKHKYVFVHVPKTGGSSMEKALLKHEGVDVPFQKWLRKELTSYIRQKHKLEVPTYSGLPVSQHLPFMAYGSSYKDWFSFAFVRNPWDRMVSEFFWVKKYVQRKSIPDNGVRDFRTWIHNTKLPQIGGGAGFHLAPQLYFTSDSGLAKHSRKLGPDFIGRFENLQEDFNTACDKIGIPKLELPHVYKTNHLPYRKFYDNASRLKVEKCYSEDIETFDYSF